MTLDLDRDTSIPLYQRLSEELRRQVESGALQPGDRLPSFAELRERYGLHKTTVERAHLLLEQAGLVIREERRGIFVTPQRRLKKEGLKGVVGFSGMGHVFKETTPYWTQLLAGVNEVLEAHSMQLLLFGDHVTDIEDRVDGVLLNPAWVKPQARWQAKKWPAVSLFIADSNVEISSVGADDYFGQRQATQHLLDLGHRRIAYLYAQISALAPRRRAGYWDALQAAGIRPDKHWMRALSGKPALDFRQTGRQSMAAWLREGWGELGCTAILMQNDGAALGAIEALEDAGYRVPQDVSVVGFDGTELCEYSRPRLTSVEVPLREIGQSAAELLMKQIENGVDEFEHIALPTRICVRETTAPPADSSHLEKKISKGI
jgi:LacI family transcriptional regulator